MFKCVPCNPSRLVGLNVHLTYCRYNPIVTTNTTLLLKHHATKAYGGVEV
jgi:hypothetical protein